MKSTITKRTLNGQYVGSIIVDTEMPGSVGNSLGRSLWIDLHKWALTEKPERDSLAEWEKRVRKQLGTCTCFNHWLRLKEKYPVDWDNLFEWTVTAHNLVNERLGKPQLAIDEARKLYVTLT
jgi:Erv1 / Alr family